MKRLLALVLLAACGGVAPADGNDSDIVVNPGGIDQLSTLTLQLPTDACLPGGGCAKPLGAAPAFTVDGTPATLGSAQTLQPGDHVIGVNGQGFRISLAAAQRRTVTLPIARAACVAAPLPSLPATDFGGTVTLSNAACPSIISTTDNTNNPPVFVPVNLYLGAGCAAGSLVRQLTPTTDCTALSSISTQTSWAAPGGACHTDTAPLWSPQQVCNTYRANGLGTPQGGVNAPLSTSAWLAYVPGVMSVQVSSTAPTFNFAEGDEQTLTLNLPAVGTVPPTFATSVTFLDPRANADAASPTITSSCAGERSYTLSTSGAPLTLTAFVNSACAYTLNVAGRTVPLSQTQPNNISLNRLDVNDVTVTRDIDNTTYTVRGSWQLNFGGVLAAGPYSTSSGIWVLPGSYDFILHFTDANGPQTQEQTLTF